MVKQVLKGAFGLLSYFILKLFIGRAILSIAVSTFLCNSVYEYC